MFSRERTRLALMSGPRTSPVWWEEAKKHLRDVDSELAQIINTVEDPPLQGLGDVVITMCNAVVGQQISAIAAEAIWGRLITLMGEEFDSNMIGGRG